MISMMDMTTGRWEKEDTAHAARCAAGDGTRSPDASQANPQLSAGLCEYVIAQPLYAGMPVEVATQNLDDFLFRMDSHSR